MIAKINLHRNKFFHSLPIKKQIVLLKQSEDLLQQPDSTSINFLARRLSAELKLRFHSVYSWLDRRYRSSKKVGNSLLPKHTKYLLDEYKISHVLSDERALLLSYVLQAPVAAIRRWFELKRNGRLKLYRSFKECKLKSKTGCDNFQVIKDGISDEDPESPHDSSVEDDYVSDPSVSMSSNGVLQVPKPLVKIPNYSEEPSRHRYPFKEYQLDIMFQAFKRCPNLNASTANQLSLQSDVPKEKIYTWFQRMRSSLAKIPSSVLLSSYRDQNLTPEQVEVLESEFRIRSYINETQLNLLADLLNVEKGVIKKWFLSRRCYDIVFLSNSSSDEENSSSTPSAPVVNWDPITDDETTGPGNCTPARSEGSHFSGVQEAENSLFEDEDHLDGKPLEEPSSTSKAEDVFEFEDDSEPILPLVRRKGNVESVASNVSLDPTSSSPEPLKKRIPLTTFQRIILRREYRKSAYITSGEAEQLAVDLKLSAKRVRLWFERMRSREMNLKSADDAPKVPGPRMKSPLTV